MGLRITNTRVFKAVRRRRDVWLGAEGKFGVEGRLQEVGVQREKDAVAAKAPLGFEGARVQTCT